MHGALLNDAKAEAHALQVMLDSPNEAVRSELMGSLREDHFYLEQTTAAYKRIISQLRNNRKPMWANILADLAIPESDRKRLDALTHNSRVTGSVKEAKEIALSLERLRQVRAIYQMAKNVSDKLSDVKEIDVDAMLEECANDLGKARRGGQASKHDDKRSDQVVSRLMDKLRSGSRDRVIPTGIPEFDRINGGVLRGTHFVVGAPSGEGKSILAENLALNMARPGFRVNFLSLEMPEAMVWTRALAYLSGVSVTAMEMRQITERKYDFIHDCYKVFQASLRKTGGCFRIETPDQVPTMDSWLAQCLPYGYDVIVIDYLTLLEGMSGDDYWRKIGEAAKYAQSFAIANDCVVISVVQTDDEGKQRLSAQIKDNAGLMWVWAKPEKRAQNQQGNDRPDYEKKGIDTFDVFMPKARMQQQLNMRVYRSKAHMQVTTDLTALQKPQVYSFPYAQALFEQLKKGELNTEEIETPKPRRKTVSVKAVVVKHKNSPRGDAQPTEEKKAHARKVYKRAIKLRPVHMKEVEPKPQTGAKIIQVRGGESKPEVKIKVKRQSTKTNKPRAKLRR
jgi:replicative DNA helicase